MTESTGSAIKQICFLSENGAHIICNCIFRNGVCIETKSGKWWRFATKGKVKRPRPEKDEDVLQPQDKE